MSKKEKERAYSAFSKKKENRLSPRKSQLKASSARSQRKPVRKNRGKRETDHDKGAGAGEKE